MDDLDFAVKFPFTNKAREILKSKNVEINDDIVDKAVSRINSGLKDEIHKPALIYDEDKIIEIASYPAARMILAFLDNRYIKSRYAVAEAKLAHKYLESSSREVCKDVGNELGVILIEKNGAYYVDVVVYLKFAPRSRDYKLINRILTNGFVLITWHEYIRLIEEAVRYGVLRNVKAYKKDIPKIAQKAVSRIYIPPSKLPKKVSEVGYPPCISDLMEKIKKHENLGHQARWVLAVYLVEVGISDEEIITIYSGLPDFNEKITMYQIQHIRKRQYKMPSCSTMRTYGLCTANCGISNPTKWQGK